MENLLPYQVEHVENLCESIKNYKRALDASDTGTGKTYTSIAICIILNLRPFIVCPKSVYSSWIKILEHYNYDESEYDIYTYNELEKHKWLSIVDEEYVWNFKKSKFQECQYLFIYDEAHKCKNRLTINARILKALSDCDVNILLLSATIVDKPFYFIIIGYVLKLYDDYEEGFKWIGNITKKSKNNLLISIHNELFNKYASRMCIDDIEDLFKRNTVIMDGIEMSNDFKIEQQYDLLNELMNDKLANKMSGIQHIRENIELLKINSFIRITNENLEQGKSVAIFVNFTKTLVELSKHFNTKCVIYGQQTKEERSENIKLFSTDQSRIIICNIQSGGCGISLHDTIGNHPRISLISPTWSAQDLIQVLGRIHRATGKTDVIQRILFCKNTFEENIGKIIKEKINNIQMLNNGSKKLKNDNMKNILENEYKIITKQKERDTVIYQTHDFEKIQNILDGLYEQQKKYIVEIKNPCNQYKIEELNYRLGKINKEIEYNENNLTKSLETLR